MASVSYSSVLVALAFISVAVALPQHNPRRTYKHSSPIPSGSRRNPDGCYEARYMPDPLKPCQGPDENSCHAQGCCWRVVYADSEQLSCFYPPVEDEKASKSKVAECEVESADKVWCGFNDQQSCLDNDCCWEDDPGSPYCFEKLASGGECAVDSEDKVACASQSEPECTAEGCCWADDPGYPYCFEKGADATPPPGGNTTTSDGGVPTDPGSTTGGGVNTTAANTTTAASTTPGSTFPPGEVCGVVNEDKVSCVIFSSNPAQCETYSCCWDQDDGVSPNYWCHENNVNRPPFYDIGLAGDFVSTTGEDFTASCIYSLNQEMTDNANDMVSKLNDRIGVELCADRNYDDILVGSSQVFLSAVGSQGTSSTSFIVRTGTNQRILDVEACAVEIFNYAREMSNWNQPILPPIAGCPDAAFVSNQFNATRNLWDCDQGGESRLLGYSTTLSGNAETVDNADLSIECADDYSEALTDTANDLIPEVNDVIGTLLCGDYPGLQLVSATGTLVANGPQATTTSTFYMRPELAMHFDDIAACAHEVALYLESFDLWGDPILPPVAGCPEVAFTGDGFNSETEDWACF